MNCKYDILYDNIRKRKLMWLTRPELGAYCLGITAWSCSALPYNPHTTSRIRPRAILASQDHHCTYTWPRAILASQDHHGTYTSHITLIPPHASGHVPSWHHRIIMAPIPGHVPSHQPSWHHWIIMALIPGHVLSHQPSWHHWIIMAPIPGYVPSHQPSWHHRNHHGTNTWLRVVLASQDHHVTYTWPRANPPAIMASLDHHGTYLSHQPS